MKTVELGGRTVDSAGGSRPGRGRRLAARELQRLENADRDLVGVAASHTPEAGAAVVAFDRDHIGHAVALEGVAHVVFQEHALDAREVGLEAGVDRPGDAAGRLVDLVDHAGARDVDQDTIGKADAEVLQVLSARRDDGVVPARAGMKERRAVESGEVAARFAAGRGAARTVAQERRGVERQQHWNAACRDVREPLREGAVERADRVACRDRRRAVAVLRRRLERLAGLQLGDHRVPVDLRM